MPKTADLFQAAQSHHAGGRAREARDLYCRVLEADPAHAGAWRCLGLIAHGAGELDLGARCLERAAALAPSDAQCHGNLGAVYLSAGRLAEAEERLRHALHLRPGYPEAQNNRGVILLRGGRYEEAAACFEASLAASPAAADTLRNLALANVLRERHAEAERLAREALRLAPDDPAALCTLGKALAGLGRAEEATACFLQALRLRPGFAEALVGLAEGLQVQGRLDDAVVCYREALTSEPGNVVAHNNLGLVLGRQRKFAEARSCCEEALRLQPDYAEAHANLGGVFLAQGRVADAERCLRTGLALKPRDHRVHSNLLFCLNHSPALGAADLFAEHRKWEEAHAVRDSAPPPRNDPSPGRRLRIGYVSPDFRQHVLAKFFQPILAHHDAAQFEVTCYAQVAQADAVTEWLQARAHRWRPTCGLSDQALADLIRADGIDILVDLAGHTAGNRLRAFTYRPAPVQVTYLGYLNTTGLSTVDYLLTDDVLHPPGGPSHSSEELFRLPRGYCCFTSGMEAPEVGPLPGAGGRVTFGSLHNLAKLNDRVFDLWAAVLRAVPSSRLLVFRDALCDEARQRLRQSFAARGIPDDRLDLRQGHANPGYLGVYNEIDVCLDTVPYSGGTTTCEALWMGVPVVTLVGDTMVSRCSAMMVSSAGLPQLVARTPEEYVAVARHLATAPGYLADLRAGLRERMRRTLCDGAGVTRGLEEAYREMWRRWCAGR